MALLQGNFLGLASDLLGIDEIIQEIQLEIDKANVKEEEDALLGSNVKKKEVILFPRWMYA